MGLYGSPETYPFKNATPPEKRPPREKSEKGKNILRRWWFWILLVWTIIGLASNGISKNSISGLIGSYSVFTFFYNGVLLAVNIIRTKSIKQSLALMGIAVLVFLLVGMISSTTAPTPTKDQYDQIEQGMSYSAVCEIMGSDGTLYHESGFGESGVEAYYWGTQTQNLYVGFLNGAVYDKGQTGLK